MPRPSPRRAAARNPRRNRGGRISGGILAAVLAVAGLPAPARAQKGERPPPAYLQLTPPDPAEGRQVLEAFRRQGIAGEYYLEFNLEVIPRRGPGQVLSGRMWGGRDAGGPVSRVSIRHPGADGAPEEVRLLVRGGPNPELWRWTDRSGAPPAAVGSDGLFAPVAGTDLTPFDLQLPFLYWPDYVYEGLARILGRPAHQFLFYPPADIAVRAPWLRGVRAYLDTQYTALVQVELIGDGNTVRKSVRVLDLKKVSDQWLVKTIDLRDEESRNKTRFDLTSAAQDQAFPAAVLDPRALAAPAEIPAGRMPLSPP